MTAFCIKNNAKQLDHFILIFNSLGISRATRMILWFCCISFRTYSYNNLGRGNIWMYDEEICEVWFSFILDSYYQQNSISDKGTWLMDDMIEAHVRKWRQWLWRYSYSTISSFITFAYSVTELLLHLCKIFYSYNIYLQNIVRI